MLVRPVSTPVSFEPIWESEVSAERSGAAFDAREVPEGSPVEVDERELVRVLKPPTRLAMGHRLLGLGAPEGKAPGAIGGALHGFTLPVARPRCPAHQRQSSRPTLAFVLAKLVSEQCPQLFVVDTQGAAETLHVHVGHLFF